VKIKIMAAAIVLIGAAALSFWAAGLIYPQSQADEQQWTHRFERNYLQLTPEQKEEVDRSHEVLRGRMAPLQKSAHSARLELMDLVAQPQPNKQAIEAKIAEIARLQESIQREVVDHLLRIKPVLSEEQQQRLGETICTGLCAPEPGRKHGGGMCQKY
jgi:Spy/CpxP family protein refolding chaperone